MHANQTPGVRSAGFGRGGNDGLVLPGLVGVVCDPCVRGDRHLRSLNPEGHLKRRSSLTREPTTDDARTHANCVGQIELRPLELIEAFAQPLCGRSHFGHE